MVVQGSAVQCAGRWWGLRAACALRPLRGVRGPAGGGPLPGLFRLQLPPGQWLWRYVRLWLLIFKIKLSGQICHFSDLVINIFHLGVFLSNVFKPTIRFMTSGKKGKDLIVTLNVFIANGQWLCLVFVGCG